LSVGGGALWAQGVQTGALKGTVKGNDGALLSDATVTVKSPSLQGVRAVKTDALGAYILKGLPPGPYSITYEHDSFANAERKASLGVGETLELSVVLSVAGPSEVVTVLAAPDAAPVQTSQGGQNFRADEIDRLAINRDPVAIASLAPGLSTNTPESTQLSIGGGFGYDSQFLIDGVDASDNVFGTLEPLYVEDAISEVQVITSGVSAEYGRFTGGVVNAVTKAGGNQFSGSFRSDVTDPRWTAQTPFEIDNKRPLPKDQVQPTYQATLGGYIVKDRLWFFTAGRALSRDVEGTTSQTALPYTTHTDDKRFEVKLTGTLNPQHTLQATYVKDNRDETNAPSLGDDLDLSTLTNPSVNRSLMVAHYSGILKPNLTVEAQISRKKQSSTNFGGSSTALIDSPFLPLTLDGTAYNGPYFDATDPEDRDNRQFSGSVSYFLSDRNFGRHDIKVGFENFRSLHTGGNSQSPSSYVFNTDYELDAAGAPVLDGNRLVPVFVPNQSLALNWRATRGAELDITTNTFYVNDSWTLKRWAFNLGARFETVGRSGTEGLGGLDTKTLVPRLAASYDLTGDGKWRVDATYGGYAGRYTDSQFALNSKVGNPDVVVLLYTGPAGAGRGFAPGFDLANYVPVGGQFNTKSVTFDSNLSAPVNEEFTLGLGHELARGYVKAIYVHRRTKDFVEDFTNLGNGTTTVTENGVTLVTVTNKVFRNSDVPQRRYDAVQLQSEYRPLARLWVGASYTLQLNNDGNFEGEAINQPGLSSAYGDYPPLLVPSRNFPMGRLASFERHRLRLYGRYQFDLGKKGTLEIGGLFNYDSPLTYSLVASNQSLYDGQIARDPGYPDLASITQSVFFGERGSGTFDAAHTFDLALRYDVPVAGRVRPYVKAQVRNLFDAQPLISFDTTIKPATDGPLDQYGIPVNYAKGPKFGQATSNSDFPTARTFLFSMGMTF
jgi:hypothetical protein